MLIQVKCESLGNNVREDIIIKKIYENYLLISITENQVIVYDYEIGKILTKVNNKCCDRIIKINVDNDMNNFFCRTIEQRKYDGIVFYTNNLYKIIKEKGKFKEKFVFVDDKIVAVHKNSEIIDFINVQFKDNENQNEIKSFVFFLDKNGDVYYKN